ncbi:MAG: hypothetical protein V4488_00960 [Pseudomonadota bacterium]
MSEPKIPPLPTGEPINRHLQIAKKVGKGGSTAASVGIQIAQVATGSSSLSVIAAAVAGGVSATGVGLVVTGGVLTIASSIAAGRAAYKTKQHLNGLNTILSNKTAYQCQCKTLSNLDAEPARQLVHNMIADHVLPYIISKKTAKMYRKGASAIPGVGLLEGIRAISKKGYKFASGTLGAKRERAAAHLARHLQRYECKLVEDIISELYSVEEMQWLKQHASHKIVTEFIMDKIKST